MTKKATQKYNSLMLYISMFIMGGCGLAYEYTFSKLSTDLLGNSSQQWALIIGIMMFFMGVGADLQTKIKSSLFDKFIYAELLLGLLGSFGPIIVLYSFSAFRSHFVLINYFFISMMGLLIGFEIPLLTRINNEFTPDLKYNIGNILKMDYLGALFGALVWVFVLPKYFDLITGAFVLGFATVLFAGVTLVYFRNKRTVSPRLYVAMFSCLIAIVIGYKNSSTWTAISEQRMYKDRIVFSKTTKYQHIVVTKSTSNTISCYINGHLQFSSADEFIYHENLVHPAMSAASSKENILVLGGGDGLAVREILKYKQVKTITLVDLDPVIVNLARTNPYFRALNNNSLNNSKVKIIKNNTLSSLGLKDLRIDSQTVAYNLESKKVAQINILNLDAMQFLQQIKGKYDVIIADFPDPNSLELAKLYSAHFYRLIKNKLSKDGVFVQQSTSPLHAKEVFLCIGRTMQAEGFRVLPFHDNVPSFGEWGWWIGVKKEVYSATGLKNKFNSIKKLPDKLQYLNVANLPTLFVFGNNQLQTTESAVNNLTSSVIYDYYLDAWQGLL